MKHFSVQRQGTDYLIKKYTPVNLADGTVDAETEEWVVPAILFDDDYWKELEELENE